ncbi:hypothetical protein [Streptomyces sp. ID05-39B]|nr:hypothetical protein [Streptomyces sp. ID05-39B]
MAVALALLAHDRGEIRPAFQLLRCPMTWCLPRPRSPGSSGAGRHER